MVQITNTLIAAALIVPAIAAPVIETREPKGGFRSIAKVGGKIASGASLGLTVGGLLQGREEVEAREPRFTSGQAKSFAKGAGAIAHTAMSGAELGAAVAPLFPHRQRREVNGQEIEAREPNFTSAQAKSFAKGAGAVAHSAKSGIELGAAVAPLFPHQRRSYDEIVEAREPFRISRGAVKGAGRAVAGAAGFAGTVAALNTQQQRSFDEVDYLEARQPFRISSGAVKGAGKALAGAAGFAGTVAALNTQQPRDLGEAELLDAREPKFRVSSSTLKHAGHAAAGAAGFAGTVAALNSQQQRDFDDFEIDAREPFGIGSIFKGVGKVAKNFIRDEETGEVYVREFDDAELIDAREPEPFGIGSIFKGVGKVAKNFIRDDETGEVYYVRDYSDLNELD